MSANSRPSFYQLKGKFGDLDRIQSPKAEMFLQPAVMYYLNNAVMLYYTTHHQIMKYFNKATIKYQARDDV